MVQDQSLWFDTDSEWMGDKEQTGSFRGRVLRGGSLVDSAAEVRSAYRFLNLPEARNLDFGFRVARTYR